MEKTDFGFAARLRDLREEAGLSMMELARKIGVSDAAICKWENGLAEPKLGYIIRLAEFFDCSTDYLIGKDGDYAVAEPPRVSVKITDASGRTVKPPAKTAPVALSQDDESLLAELKALPPDVRAALRETVRALGGKKTNVKTAPSSDD